MTNNFLHNLIPGRTEESESAAKGGHGWMMMICCIPMVIIAVALVAAGAVSPAFLVAAGLCVGMMAMMMRGMNHDSSQHHN